MAQTSQLQASEPQDATQAYRGGQEQPALRTGCAVSAGRPGRRRRYLQVSPSSSHRQLIKRIGPEDKPRCMLCNARRVSSREQRHAGDFSKQLCKMLGLLSGVGHHYVFSSFSGLGMQ